MFFHILKNLNQVSPSIIEVSTSSDCTALCEADVQCTSAWFDSLALSPGASANSLPLCGLCVHTSCDFDCTIAPLNFSEKPELPRSRTLALMSAHRMRPPTLPMSRPTPPPSGWPPGS